MNKNMEEILKEINTALNQIKGFPESERPYFELLTAIKKAKPYFENVVKTGVIKRSTRADFADKYRISMTSNLYLSRGVAIALLDDVKNKNYEALGLAYVWPDKIINAEISNINIKQNAAIPAIIFSKNF